MSDDEVNKIIAEFMGLEVLDPTDWSQRNRITKSQICSDSIKMQYHLSLDELVPVWEKLHGVDGFYDMRLSGYYYPGYIVTLELIEGKFHSGKAGDKKDSIQQAAAHATAKAIMELNARK